MRHPEQVSTNILNDAAYYQATDVHFSPDESNCYIHFRISGFRWFYKKIPLHQYASLLSYYKFSSGMDIAENRLPQDGTLTFQHDNERFYLRLSTLPVQHSESLAIRMLPDTYEPTIEDLFVFPEQSKSLMDLLKLKAGIILFTGPTGSGKSSTMYALLKQSTEQFGYQSVTLEDPIEQTVDQTLQVQVNETAGINYELGLKAALRHDPDLIMIGEIRDEKTAKFAIRAALTGHLVLSTLHAKNAYGTLIRLKQMGITQEDLKASVIGIITQELIPLTNRYKMDVHADRRAIAELLTGDLLSRAIDGFPPENSDTFQSLERLRRKAHALGYVQSKEIKRS